MPLLVDHEFIPACDTDSRSPCPALNALANHGILPRDGRNISAFQLMGAIRKHYHLSLPMAFVLSFFGTLLCGRWFKVDLQDFARHDCIEHDGSLTRRNAMPGDLYAPVDVDKDLLDDLLNVTKDPDVLSFDDLVVVRARRNQTLTRPLAGFHNAIALGEVALTAETLRDRNGDVPKQFIREWFGDQKLPDGWSRPATPIGLWKTSQLVKRVRKAVEKKPV